MATLAPRYLLDTNIWSALIRRSSQPLIEKFRECTPNQLVLSPIVWGELQLGYFKGDKTPKRKQVIEHIASMVSMLAIDAQVATAYAKLRAQLEHAGTPIGPNDTWIAAEVLHHQLTLVTDNVREFARVPHLKLENWLE